MPALHAGPDLDRLNPPVLRLTDSHCHLDAPEFDADRDAVREAARAAGVHRLLLPAVARSQFDVVQALAARHADVYALGIHPLYVMQAADDDLGVLDAALAAARSDPRLVAVGEIGLDLFVPGLREGAGLARQLHLFREQLRLARRHGLPVVLHVRRSVDLVLRQLRELRVCGGIAHAFNGSLQQAHALIDLGFRLGFGGATTHERARQLRRLAAQLPLSALVLETDAPDIPPAGLYRTAAERAAGQPQGRNTPAELPRIARELAQLRGIDAAELAASTEREMDAVLALGARAA